MHWCYFNLVGGRSEEGRGGGGERTGKVGKAGVLLGLQLHRYPGRSYVKIK